MHVGFELLDAFCILRVLVALDFCKRVDNGGGEGCGHGCILTRFALILKLIYIRKNFSDDGVDFHGDFLVDFELFKDVDEIGVAADGNIVLFGEFNDLVGDSAFAFGGENRNRGVFGVVF